MLRDCYVAGAQLRMWSKHGQPECIPFQIPNCTKRKDCITRTCRVCAVLAALGECSAPTTHARRSCQEVTIVHASPPPSGRCRTGVFDNAPSEHVCFWFSSVGVLNVQCVQHSRPRACATGAFALCIYWISVPTRPSSAPHPSHRKPLKRIVERGDSRYSSVHSTRMKSHCL